MFLGMSIIVGPQTPPLLSTVVHPFKKYFLVLRFWWNKNQKIGFGLNYFFGKKNFKIFYKFFFKKSKTRFSKKVNSIKILNFFFTKKSLDQNLSFGFCFIKIKALKSTFWGGVPLLGGGGGVCGPTKKIFPDFVCSKKKDLKKLFYRLSLLYFLTCWK